MSTRANIKFSDKWDTFYLDRSHDGFPENVMQDIKEAVDSFHKLFGSSELGQLVSIFIGLTFEKNIRVQRYEICDSVAGDCDYCYWVKWDEDKNKYHFGVYED